MKVQRSTGITLSMVMLVTLGAVIIGQAGPDAQTILSTLRGLSVEPGMKAATCLILFLLMVLGAVTPFPIKLVALSGAVILEPGEAFVLTWLGSLCGAILACEMGRFGSIDLCASPRSRRLCQWLQRHGGKALLLMRLFPVVPFFALNISAGIFRLDRMTYVTVTAAGILPAVAVLTLFPQLFL